MVKKIKCWEKIKEKKPYNHGTWVNKKGERVRIISDIGFGKQRNVIVDDLTKQMLTGPKVIKVEYESNEKDALKKAKSYMKKHDVC